MLERQKAFPLEAPQSCKAMRAFDVKPGEAKDDSCLIGPFSTLDLHRHTTAMIIQQVGE